jgi:hypothetical protein
MTSKQNVRRHHNTKGLRQVQRGRPYEQMRALAKRLGVPFGKVLVK